MCGNLRILLWTAVGFSAAIAAVPLEAAEVTFNDDGEGQLAIAIDQQPVAVYTYEDAVITRPFFAHVRTPGGLQVTRNHPPIPGRDRADHPTFHPGLWMAFGNISGSDYWRLEAPVEHVEWVEPPRGGTGRGTFTVRNRYWAEDDADRVVCEEVAQFTVLVRPRGYLLLWDTSFSSDEEVYFGDEEEMGIALRVATPIRVERNAEGELPPGNGTMTDSEGRRNGEEIWGNTADWCDYSGTLDGKHVGMTLLCHPKNFRPSWFHARDYGLLEANAFGRNAFGKGEPSRVVVEPGDSLRLRYGVFVHAGPEGAPPDLHAIYRDYVNAAGN